MTRSRFCSISLLKFLISATACLLAAPAARAQQEGPIRIGYAVPRTGPFAIAAQGIQELNYVLWAEQVNARGGLKIQGKRRKVELVGHDTAADVERTVRIYEQLMAADKVDLILAPWGTDANVAVTPLANKYGYPVLAPTALSRRLLAMKLPYFFSVLQEPDRMMGAIVDLLAANGVKTVGIAFMDDLFGQENVTALMPLLRSKGIDVAARQSYPVPVQDLSPVLRTMKEANVEAFLGITYAPDGLLMGAQAKEIGFAPKLFYLGVGPQLPVFRERMGAGAEHVMGMGSWNAKVSPSAKAYFEAYKARHQREPDRWAGGHCWAALEILQQAVEKVGLDRAAIRDYIAQNEFQTVVGPIRFSGGENVSTPGTVGQWQKGEFEVIWPPARATAQPVFPKHAWR